MGNKLAAPILGRNGEPATSIFDFDVENIDGTTTKLSDYADKKKVYYIVNVASEWGLTKKNYEEMQILYDKYNKCGLELFAFPCNNVSFSDVFCYVFQSFGIT